MVPLLKNTSQRIKFFLTTFLAGVLLSIAVPPMSSPDEMDHVSRGLMLAEGQILLQVPGPPPNGTPDDARYHSQSGGMIDVGLVSYYHHLHRTLNNRDARFSEKDAQKLRSFRWEDKSLFFATPGTGYYIPIIYAPHAAGIGLGKSLGLPIHSSYILMRMTVLISSLMILTYAFSLGRPSLPAIALLMLPMSLFQFISPVLDGLTLALAVLAIVLFQNCHHLHQKISNRHLWIFSASIFLLVTSRPHFLPLLLLLVYLAFRDRSIRIAAHSIGITMLSFAWLLYALFNTIDLRIQRTLNFKDAAYFYLTHLGELKRLIFETFSNPEVITFYWRSAIGILGWLDAPLPTPHYWVLTIVFLLTVLGSLPATQFRDAPGARFALALTGLAILTLTFLALLLSWTPIPAKIIEGVQGRYFSVPTLFLAAALTNWDGSSILDSRPTDRAILLSIFVSTSVLGLFTALFNRYH